MRTSTASLRGPREALGGHVVDPNGMKLFTKIIKLTVVVFGRPCDHAS
jgi:hypothetical protein